MTRRGFLGGAAAAGAMVLGGEALAQTALLESKKKAMEGVDALVVEFSKLSLSGIVKKANAKQSADIAQLETEQLQRLRDVVKRFKTVLQEAERIQRKRPSPDDRSYIDDAYYVQGMSEKLVTEESKMNGLLTTLGLGGKSAALMSRRKIIIDRIVKPIQETPMLRLFVAP